VGHPLIPGWDEKRRFQLSHRLNIHHSGELPRNITCEGLKANSERARLVGHYRELRVHRGSPS
jgi:hypothetical protein